MFIFVVVQNRDESIYYVHFFAHNRNQSTFINNAPFSFYWLPSESASFSSCDKRPRFSSAWRAYGVKAAPLSDDCVITITT